MFTPNSQFPLMNIKETDNSIIITRCLGEFNELAGAMVTIIPPKLFIF